MCGKRFRAPRRTLRRTSRTETHAYFSVSPIGRLFTEVAPHMCAVPGVRVGVESRQPRHRLRVQLYRRSQKPTSQIRRALRRAQVAAPVGESEAPLCLRVSVADPTQSVLCSLLSVQPSEGTEPNNRSCRLNRLSPPDPAPMLTEPLPSSPSSPPIARRRTQLVPLPASPRYRPPPGASLDPIQVGTMAKITLLGQSESCVTAHTVCCMYMCMCMSMCMCVCMCMCM